MHQRPENRGALNKPIAQSCSEHLHQWSQPSKPTATCAQRVVLSLAIQRHSQN